MPPVELCRWESATMTLFIYSIRRRKLPRPKPRTIEYRRLKNINTEKFLCDLKNIPWDSAYVYENADDIWEHWSTLYKDVLDQHAPLRKKQIRSDQLPWITPTILREITRRNRLYKKHKQRPTATSWDTYRSKE